MSLYILPRAKGSMSAKLLAEELGVVRIRLENSKFRPDPNKIVYNMGHSELPIGIYNCHIINHPATVAILSDKKETFRSMVYASIPTLEFAFNAGIAEEWLKDGFVVVCRKYLKSYGGRGIKIITPEEYSENTSVLPTNYPLYTKYFPKKTEYRLHFTKSGVFYIQKKVVSREYVSQVGRENINWKVRSSSNGFIFQHSNLVVPDKVIELGEMLRDLVRNTCHEADVILAADVLYNEKRDLAVVCEINTAPGL